MTPLEFLFKLQKLSPATPLVIAHLGAIFEMLSPVIVRESSSPITLEDRLTSEESLAKWLGQPGPVVQQWRIEGSSTSPTQYRLGTVYEWIIAHIIPVFAGTQTTENSTGDQLDDMAAAWKMKIPLMEVDGKLVGFFRSVKEESKPSKYRFVDIPALSFPLREMARENIPTINASLVAHANFSIAITNSITEARALYEKWESQALPEVRLLFFRSALPLDADFANEIAENIDVELIHKNFDVTLWLWQQLLEKDFCSFAEGSLTSALEVAVHNGVDLNRLSHAVDDHRQEVFDGSIAHLLADTRGDFSNLPPLDNFLGSYDKLMKCVLDLGLDVEQKNRKGLSATYIAETIEDQNGKGKSPFFNFITKYRLNQKLNVNRIPTKSLTRKPAF